MDAYTLTCEASAWQLPEVYFARGLLSAAEIAALQDLSRHAVRRVYACARS